MCIGSVVGPLLTEFYLSTLDRKITDFVRSVGVDEVLAWRFVDEILDCTPRSHSATEVHNFILTAAPELKFTSRSQKNE